ncbi:MAG: hypothetical protein ACRDRO_13415 [Pseudonocardiaceae bacterium]
MTKRLDDCNSSVDTQLARAGACAQIHLPSGRICVLPHHHRGSCRFLSASDIADAEEFLPWQRIAGDHDARSGPGRPVAEIPTQHPYTQASPTGTAHRDRVGMPHQVPGDAP